MAAFSGRSEELARLASVLDGLGPDLTVVRGREGAGTTALVARALTDRAHRSYVAVPVTDADHRALLAERLDLTPGGDWPALLDQLADRLERTRDRTVLVLDGVEHLLAARSRLPVLLAAFWARVRGHALPLHLVLVGSDPAALGALTAEGSPLADMITLDLELGALPFREVTTPLRGWAARDRIVAWAALGGMPSVVRWVDPALGLLPNLRKIVLDPDAPLLRAGTDMLRRLVQSPARYASILMAIAQGRREWGDIARAVPDFGSSGQLAPYLGRLEELRLVETRRSLDAREGSRSRRYHPTDPFVAFWFRFVLPNFTELERGQAADVWARRIRPFLDDHVRLQFGELAREYVARYAERLPGPAREIGALWGPGYELDVAATLRGGAVCYGACSWEHSAVGEEAFGPIVRALRDSRYGFGRESRLEVVFHAGGVGEDLVRRAAREDQIRLVGLEDLLGTA
jgi:AAA+ ATPase superfamily predicted ATPase